MKLALLLSLVNPAVGGVLLIGPRGTGKTTAVRSLVDLLPGVSRSLCYYGCLPEDVETGGMDAVCPDCARKYAEGQPMSVLDRVHLIELPLNARLDDVLGGLDERAAVNDRMRLKRGILAQADRNILYVDEINLLAEEISDALLDAAAQGRFTVRRGPLSATYRSRFILIGSMNPEEGRLRPQIMDRYGLRVIVGGLTRVQERLDAYRRVRAYQANPSLVAAAFALETERVREEIQQAQDSLAQVVLSDEVARMGLEVICQLGIDSLRAEMTLFEAARACTAIDGRVEVTPADLLEVIPMALRMRRTGFMQDYCAHQQLEEGEILNLSQRIISPERSS
jgi:magnesium chelatase subunit I